MIVLPKNKELTPGDLGINVRDDVGALVDPVRISYSIFAVGEGETKSLISAPNMVPKRCGIGSYYVGITIPSLWHGKCNLVWYIQVREDAPEGMVHEEFEVLDFDPLSSGLEAPSMLLTHTAGLTPRVIEMIVTTRELLSDKNPQRDYHFRPPTPGKVVAGFTTRVGFIWTDQTIIRFLKLSVAQINSWNPLTMTQYTINSLPPNWGEAAALGAAAKCLSAEGARWSEENFSYSLNGVSLDLNKSGEYQSLASAYQQEFETWLPLLTANRPAILGLRQQRWLLG